MNRVIRTELLKQRTLRTFRVGVALAPLVAGLVTVAIFSAAGRDGNAPLSSASLVESIGGPVSIITVIAVVLGVLGMAGEYRHQTITTTFLATPRRRRVVMAKLAAHAITGALIGALSLVVSVAVAVSWLNARGIAVHIDDDVIRVAAGVIGSSALYGALGVSIAALIRNQTAACAAVLVWLMAVEGIVGDVFHGSAFVHWLPAAAAHVIAHGARVGGPSVPMAAAVFTAYVAAFAAAATRITLQRDVT
jgi:ABC-2 type transport system permease protein